MENTLSLAATQFRDSSRQYEEALIQAVNAVNHANYAEAAYHYRTQQPTSKDEKANESKVKHIRVRISASCASSRILSRTLLIWWCATRTEKFTVRYKAVDAMLLNEFLKEHRKVEEQDRKVQELETTIAKQQKQIEVLATGIQKVSDRLELSKPAPQVVENNQ